MTDNVHNIAEADEDQRTLINALRDLLARAETGELRTLCGVGQLEDRTQMVTVHAGHDDNTVETIGALSALSTRLQMDWLDQVKPPE